MVVAAKLWEMLESFDIPQVGLDRRGECYICIQVNLFFPFTLIPTLNQKCEVWKVGKGGRVEIICVEERSCQLGYPSYAPGHLLPQGFLGAIP